jgi:hypothetical protein
MKAIEFQTQLNPDQALAVPALIAESIPVGRPFRVLVLIGEDDTEQQWEQLAAMEFGQRYADDDAIYDELAGR